MPRVRCTVWMFLFVFLLCGVGLPVYGAGPEQESVALLGIPVEFIIFATTLLGVALFHHSTFTVALGGLAAITLYKLFFAGFKTGAGLTGLALHLGHEWVTLANLFFLLMGFALLSKHFEDSGVPRMLPG